MTLIHVLCLHTTNCHTHNSVEKNIGIRTKSWKDSNFLQHKSIGVYRLLNQKSVYPKNLDCYVEHLQI